MRDTKNVLIIGNGYDLDHGLPTKYSHFLDFVDKLIIDANNQSKEFSNDTIPKELIILISSSVKYYGANTVKDLWCTQNKKPLYTIGKLLENNILFNYLRYAYNQNFLGENWIDFESEISFLIQTLDEFSSNLENEFRHIYNEYKALSNEDLCSKSKLRINHFVCLVKENVDRIKKNEQHIPTFMDIRKILFDDLKRLICALEIYLSEFVDKLKPTSKSNVLCNVNFERVISFNYTHTAQKNYPNAEIIYIHGECQQRKELLEATASDFDKVSKKAIRSNNMVIGIDEYFTDNRKNTHTNYVVFKKFVQRIQNHTDRFTANLFDFTAEANQLGTDYPQVIVHVFGHSLDVTDEDILKQIFNSKHIDRIIIYCYDKPTQGKYIANIIKIITQDGFIKYIDSGKIDFFILNQ